MNREPTACDVCEKWMTQPLLHVQYRKSDGDRAGHEQYLCPECYAEIVAQYANPREAPVLVTDPARPVR